MNKKLNSSNKIKLYLNKRSLLYAINHPLLAVRSFYGVARNDSSPESFVCALLSVTKDQLSEVAPSSQSKILIKKAFQASIAPSTLEMPASLEEGWSLYYIVRLLKPKIVIETGVSAGRSSTFILAALNDNGCGKLYSIDTNPGSGYAIPISLKVNWHFFNSRSDEVLPTLIKELKIVDLFLHDSLHTYDCMLYEYQTIWPCLKDGGILLSDDVDRNSAIIDFSKEVNADIVYLKKDFAGFKKCE